MPQDLRSLLSNKALIFEENHALTVLYNILCALNFLHSANIIHRDLKPANILINSTCEIKLCDFGLSTSFEYKVDKNDNFLHAWSKITKRGTNVTQNEYLEKPRGEMTQNIMTRWYRAPEVILLNPYDYKIDMWSAGCVFGELLNFT